MTAIALGCLVFPFAGQPFGPPCPRLLPFDLDGAAQP